MIKKLLSPFRKKASSEVDPTASLSRSEMVMLSRLVDEKAREFIEVRLGVPIHKFVSYQSYLHAGCKKVWASMRAVDLIAATAISANFKVVDKNSKDDKPLVPSPRDPDWLYFAKGGFLEKPNPYDTWEELMKLTVAHLEFTGNAYWLKDDLDLRDRATGFYPLLPQHMQIVPDKDKKVAYYEYRVNGKVLKFEQDEIIHFKYPNPMDLMLGLGAIESGESIYQKFIGKTDLDLKFMENGARPSGVMTLDDASVTDPDEWDMLKKKFNKEYAGKKNSGKTAFLNGKWSYHQLGLTQKEMEAIESEKWTVEQIFLNHGVPLSLAGVQGAANYATARMDESNFRRYKVVPLIDIIVGKLNADGILQAAGPGFRLTYELYGVIDVEQISKVHLPLVREGVITRNEFREMLGLKRAEGNPHMDQFTVQAHTIPIELAGLANLSNEDMIRVYGNIIGGEVGDDIIDNTDDLPDDPDDEEPKDTPNSGPFPPPKKGKAPSYPAKPKRKKR